MIINDYYGSGLASGLIIAPAGRWDVIYKIERWASVISAG